MSEHHCHAIGCKTPCKPEMLMCYTHWKKVPKPMQRAVWAAYRHGQCDDKKISRQWLIAADTAIAAVALKEGKISQAQADTMIAKARDFNPGK